MTSERVGIQSGVSKVPNFSADAAHFPVSLSERKTYERLTQSRGGRNSPIIRKMVQERGFPGRMPN
jgi:hypothetical protein